MLYAKAIAYTVIHHSKALFLLVATLGLFAAAGTLSAKTYTEYPPFENQLIQVRNYSASTTLDRLECRSITQRKLPRPAYCTPR